MGSSRLPGKVLMPIAGRPLLGCILERLDALQFPASIVVATSKLLGDDQILSLCNARKISVFRGDENDVLERFFKCAVEHRFDHVIRLTADNPFTDIQELERLIQLHISGGYDYSHSFGELPIGVGAEAFTFSALKKSFNCGLKQNHREHVNEYIHENLKLFKIGILKVHKLKHHSNLSLTLDTHCDYLRLCDIAEKAKNIHVETRKLIELCLQSA